MHTHAHTHTFTSPRCTPRAVPAPHDNTRGSPQGGGVKRPHMMLSSPSPDVCWIGAQHLKARPQKLTHVCKRTHTFTYPRCTPRVAPAPHDNTLSAAQGGGIKRPRMMLSSPSPPSVGVGPNYAATTTATTTDLGLISTFGSTCAPTTLYNTGPFGGPPSSPPPPPTVGDVRNYANTTNTDLARLRTFSSTHAPTTTLSSTGPFGVHTGAVQGGEGCDGGSLAVPFFPHNSHAVSAAATGMHNAGPIPSSVGADNFGSASHNTALSPPMCAPRVKAARMDTSSSSPPGMRLPGPNALSLRARAWSGGGGAMGSGGDSHMQGSAHEDSNMHSTLFPSHQQFAQSLGLGALFGGPRTTQQHDVESVSLSPSERDQVMLDREEGMHTLHPTMPTSAQHARNWGFGVTDSRTTTQVQAPSESMGPVRFPNTQHAQSQQSLGREAGIPSLAFTNTQGAQTRSSQGGTGVPSLSFSQTQGTQTHSSQGITEDVPSVREHSPASLLQWLRTPAPGFSAHKGG